MILKKNEFCEWIERYKTVRKENYMSSIIAACESFSVDPDSVKPLLNDQIISKLEAEAIKLNQLKNTTKIRLTAFI